MVMNAILPLSVAIPTYGRERVLLDTIQMLLNQTPRAREILILDQTQHHEAETDRCLQQWHDSRDITWIRLSKASQPGALNEALRVSKSEFVLFLDDDIRIEPGFLDAHMRGFESDAIWAVAGQVLQPGETPDVAYCHQPSSGPFADSRFCFRSAHSALIENGMSGNLSVRRSHAVDIGGFDENFLPPVAYRFDNDFCKRLCQAGGKIRFQPEARIHHLRASRGGTRSNSSHLTSASPEHGVGDYYFAMKHSRGLERWRYVTKRLFREVRTKFHAIHPWWIPVKLLGEIRAIRLALHLVRQGPVTVDSSAAIRCGAP